MIKHEKNKPSHRLFIRIIDKNKPIRLDRNGNKLFPTRWVEVSEINFGSCKNPNKDIIEFKIEPIEYEEDDDNENENKFRGRFFRR
jgi:hypothetical protein